MSATECLAIGFAVGIAYLFYCANELRALKALMKRCESNARQLEKFAEAMYKTGTFWGGDAE